MQEPKPAPIPVTVVAGFLGAGKTTLLNHILTADHGRRLGVLVNDFGAINVDAELVAEVVDGMVSLANGCICCSIRMDLIRAVLELAGRPDRPEHIVIESSGVADPAGIVASFLEPGIWGTVQLDGVITVVDAEQVLELPETELDLARVQLRGGDLVALNKVDLVDRETLSRVREWIEDVRPGVQVFETVQCRLPIEILLGKGVVNAGRAEPGAELAVHVHEVPTGAGEGHGAGHDHGHGLMFDTWTFTSSSPMHLPLLQELLIHAPSTLFRVKGFVDAAEEPGRRVALQLVGRRVTISATRGWGGEPPETRLVFISRHQSVDFAVVEKVLRGCEVEVGTP